MSIDFNQPPVVAAVVAGLVTTAVGLFTVFINWLVAEKRVQEDRNLVLSERAWADYELRRNIYLDMAHQIACLFVSGGGKATLEFSGTTRKVRLVGSDQVVEALNALTQCIKDGLAPNILEQRYRAFFNAMRRDIRQLHAKPPQGTDLGEEAFPIEG